MSPTIARARCNALECEVIALREQGRAFERMRLHASAARILARANYLEDTLAWLRAQLAAAA